LLLMRFLVPGPRASAAVLVTASLLLAGILFPAAAPVVCVGEDHRAVEDLLDGCCPAPVLPGADALVDEGCGACVDLVAVSALVGATAPVAVGSPAAPPEPLAADVPPGAGPHPAAPRPVLDILATVVLLS